ncbi:glycosyltransferase [Dichotomopilus funicola]|uniref:Glycosyltransferase n=1 Tax=Dichotomopilus funicola TaxID=1934379 RepID=A0AAN6UXB7_9PEZI|nr:glycosyltransferase [Dichotomopilus funicola]
MPSRKLLVTVQVAAVAVIALYFLLTRLGASPIARTYEPKLTVAIPGVVLPSATITQYLNTILNATDTTLPKFACPPPNFSRYEHLRSDPPPVPPQIRYFFALNLRNNLPILPQLLSSILSAALFLGPQQCALSIVEGNSPDGTADILSALQPLLVNTLHLRTFLAVDNGIDPLSEGVDRFAALANLRNLALAPLTTGDPSHYTPDATVIFLNDVAACPDDILELLHQRRRQDAHMACALDWTSSDPSFFYDVYVARTLQGDLFFPITPETAGWEHSGELMWSDPVAKGRMERHEPFQVFSCWNGAVVFTAQPLVEGRVKFRGARKEKGECRQGEVQAFCKDLWWNGFGRIMVVPTVNLEYSVEMGRKVKEERGYVTDLVKGEKKESNGEGKMEWMGPPEKVLCMPRFEEQSWRPWNETLP